MSNEKEFGVVNEGDAAKLIPVELKDHSKDPVITELVKEMEKQTGVPTELVAPVIEKKKRGRPKKSEVKPEKIWYCSTCRETISDQNAMRIGAGTNRYAVFCPQCTRSFGFEDQVMQDTVAKLIRDNPTGK
jgi:hypothetical protein